MIEYIVDPEDFVPPDKSYIIRAAMLDLLNGKTQTRDYLRLQVNLSTDLQSVLDIERRRTESATLYRFVTFAGWLFQDSSLHMEKIGTLRRRPVSTNPDIVNWSQEDLLTLDHGTSQWASAAAICGDPWRVKDPPPKLQLTYDVISHWKKNLLAFGPDPTILEQMKSFDHFRDTLQMRFEPQHAEDYCFARAFDLMTPAEGLSCWPSLRGHESDRIAGMEGAMRDLNDHSVVASKDHRVVQALAMMSSTARFAYSGCTRKSWPLFWEYLDRFPGYQGRL